MFEPFFLGIGCGIPSVSFDRKMAFWMNSIRRWCMQKQTAAFNVHQLMYEFQRDGQLPDCLPSVVLYMIRYESCVIPLFVYVSCGTHAHLTFAQITFGKFLSAYPSAAILHFEVVLFFRPRSHFAARQIQRRPTLDEFSLAN